MHRAMHDEFDADASLPASPVLVSVSAATGPAFAALQVGARALALTHWVSRGIALRGAGSTHGLLGEWPANAPLLRSLCEDPQTMATIAREGMEIASLRLHAPVAPGQVFCSIGNYRCQWLEAALDAGGGPLAPDAPERRAAALAAIAERVRSGEPYVSLKSRSSVAGPCDPLAIDADQTRLDWEVEIGVVIGRPAWRVSVAQALDHVAGYCVVNDITARDRVFRGDPKAFGTDWLQSKGGPGWLPVGPWLVPAWQVGDPAALRLRLALNGRTMQQGNAREMVFTIAEQIAYLSRHTRLEPGDLLCTGSPAGFGSHHGRYLQPGDLIEAGVEGLGLQRVRCVASHATNIEPTREMETSR